MLDVSHIINGHGLPFGNKVHDNELPTGPQYPLSMVPCKPILAVAHMSHSLNS